MEDAADAEHLLALDLRARRLAALPRRRERAATHRQVGGLVFGEEVERLVALDDLEALGDALEYQLVVDLLHGERRATTAVPKTNKSNKCEHR